MEFHASWICDRAKFPLLNEKIAIGAIDLDQITDMPSLTVFKDRLNEVLKIS
jgi:hypothetical protein